MKTYSLAVECDTNENFSLCGVNIFPKTLSGQYVCTISTLNALQLWTKDEWEKLCVYVSALDSKQQKMLRPLFAFAVTMDVKDNRLPVPRFLLDYVCINSTASLCITDVGERYIAIPDNASTVSKYDTIPLATKWLATPKNRSNGQDSEGQQL